MSGDTNRSIVIKLRGGLGNQLFQYSYGLVLLEYGLSKKIIVDTRDYKNYYWPISIDKYLLNENVSFSNGKEKYDLRVKFFHLYQYIYRHLTKKELIPFKRWTKKGYLFTDIFSPNPSDIKTSKDVFLYGYFQDSKYLVPIRDKLLSEFTLRSKRKELDELLKTVSEDAICLSIRIAEKIELDSGEEYVYSSADYYQKAIDYISTKRGKIPQIVVMSNQVATIKENKWFNNYKDVIFVDGFAAEEQIEIFKRCKDFVISNSTFAWWGAFLGSTNKDSIIVTPHIWYQGKKLEDTHLKFQGMVVIS